MLAAAVAAVLLLFMWASLQVGAATETRNAAEADKSAAQQKVNQLSDVPRVTAQITDMTKALNMALSNEVLFSQLTDKTAKAMPQGTVLDAMTWTLAQATDAKQATASGAATEKEDYGDLSLSGTVCGFDGGAAL